MPSLWSGARIANTTESAAANSAKAATNNTTRIFIALTVIGRAYKLLKEE